MSWEETYFVDMTKVLSPGELGEAKVVHHRFTEQEKQHMRMRAAFGRPDEMIHDPVIVQLFVGGHLMMSTTNHERRTNIDVMMHAHGRVLIAGLGLGMLLPYMIRSQKVEHITVIEKSHDVMMLVGQQLYRLDGGNEKLTIINADILDWTPAKGQKYNTIYFDIWGDICEDNIPEISKLNRRFGRRLDRTDPAAWMGAWMEETLRWRRRHQAGFGWR